MKILKITLAINLALGLSMFFIGISISMLAIFSICTIINIIGIYDIIQSKHTIMKNYPIVGRFRWLAEELRPKIAQYFIENDLNGTPINREDRSVVYQRSKLESDKVPFGTQLDVYKNGYEFIAQTIFPSNISDISEPRILIGSDKIKNKYSASILNISAMSYGALSSNAVISLNTGAKMGNFYHNTGEGGISPYHKKGGDLVYQIGTGYFGCGSTINGKQIFDIVKFKETFDSTPTIKMIEIKISQGAKAAHGGVLPAKKNTEEIANIRGVEKGIEIISPAKHSAFNNFVELLDFITILRTATDFNIPIGIKMCVGDISELYDMLDTFKKNDNYPDFITIDGGEGGTGAAPIEFTNSVGMPLYDALPLVKKGLIDRDLHQIKIITSAKVMTAFDIIKMLALGADAVNSARAFLLSLGCIQARVCDKNTCPTGITTQNKNLVNGLDPEVKSVRVYNFHKETIKAVKELMTVFGITNTRDISADKIYRRVDDKIKNLHDIYLKR